MTTVVLAGHIDANGQPEIHLPRGLPSGEVRVTLAFADQEPPLTDAEIEDVMRVEPKSGAEIVARLGEAWEDQGITDGAAWVGELRRKRPLSNCAQRREGA